MCANGFMIDVLIFLFLTQASEPQRPPPFFCCCKVIHTGNLNQRHFFLFCLSRFLIILAPLLSICFRRPCLWSSFMEYRICSINRWIFHYPNPWHDVQSTDPQVELDKQLQCELWITRRQVASTNIQHLQYRKLDRIS